jgi:hypothetical protein
MFWFPRCDIVFFLGLGSKYDKFTVLLKISPGYSVLLFMLECQSNHVKKYSVIRNIIRKQYFMIHVFSVSKFHRKLPVSDVTVGEYDGGCQAHVLFRGFVQRTGQVSVSSMCTPLTQVSNGICKGGDKFYLGRYLCGCYGVRCVSGTNFNYI